MRITSGEFRGRAISAPPGEDVRPTQDRVREALFSMLGECVRGATFLDLFAGTGAVGFEAVSRGAAKAVFVEMAPRSIACISANVERAGAGPRCETHRADALSWLASCPVTADIAFADPPYALGDQGVYAEVMRLLAERNVVTPGGIFVAEMASRRACDDSPAWELLRDRVYGQSRLAVYRRK